MLFIQASVRSAGHATSLATGHATIPVQAACVLGVYGDGHTMELDPKICALADQRAIDVTLGGILEWAARDGLFD